jgi:MFS family permease
VGLGTLFGMMYFVQGFAEPTAGLISQPLKSLLREWGHSVAEITTFMMLVGIPWFIKPLYGLLSDYVPLAGRRRKSYLILTTAMTVAGLLAVWLAPLGPGSATWLLIMLLPPTVGVAFSDVVIDALMVEKGQPLGLTGRLQSVQWAMIYAATVLTGTLGGWLSEGGRQREGFLICCVLTAVTLVLSVSAVREPRVPRSPASFRAAVRELGRASLSPVVQGVGGFIFLWNFNPFSSDLLYLYMVDEMKFTEQFYGDTLSLSAVASIVACVTYGLYCRLVPLRWLLHVSIVLGILSTAAYWLMVDKPTAVAISLVVGFVYVTATLIQLDVAARACPPESAATIFALLMALSNLSTIASTGVGGPIYEHLKESWDARTAFNLLVALGAICTAGCWLLVPLLLQRLHQPTSPQAQQSHATGAA